VATIEQVDELKRKMLEERTALIVASQALSSVDALSVPEDAEGEEQWTALEQLAHLSEMEWSYDAWVRAALLSDNPDLTGVRGEDVDIPIQDANGHSVETMLRILEVERSYTRGLIDGLSLEAFDRTATSPVFGTLTVLQWLRSFYRHDRQHAAQIAGRQSDYKPNFKGGAKEPNQRQARIDLVAKQKK
jgi:hypothetical protein